MIDGVKVKELKIIPDGRGLLMEMGRSDDPEYNSPDEHRLPFDDESIGYDWLPKNG